MSAEEWLNRMGFPAALMTDVGECELLEGPPRTYDLQSRGRLGGRHGTLFRPEGDTAHIVGVGKIGWLGSRRLNTPIERHVEALRLLGFIEVVFPNGTGYEIRRGVPGMRRISA